MTEKDRRPYITVTNELFRHPKWLRLNDKAKLYLLELWGHCNEFRTDGMVEDFLLFAKGKKVGQDLIATGWVEPTSDPVVFYMHDYLEHQPSRDEIEQRIKEKREAGSTGGKRSAHTRWHVNRGVLDDKCEYCRAVRAG